MQQEEERFNLQKYQELLDKHDWFFRSTDDPGVYDRGLENEMKLKKLARQDSVFMAMYIAKETSYFPQLAN